MKKFNWPTVVIGCLLVLAAIAGGVFLYEAAKEYQASLPKAKLMVKYEHAGFTDWQLLHYITMEQCIKARKDFYFVKSRSKDDPYLANRQYTECKEIER